MLYYKDDEIYNAVKRGVALDVLAELNCCSVTEIQQAYNRYKSVLKKKGREYDKMLLSGIQRTLSKHNYLETEGRKNMSQSTTSTKRKARFKYSEKLLNEITERVLEGERYADIYHDVFAGADDKPLLTAFSGKCKKIKDSYSDYEKDAILKSKRDAKLSAVNLQPTTPERDITELKDTLDLLLKELSDYYKASLYELIKISIKLDELTK